MQNLGKFSIDICISIIIYILDSILLMRVKILIIVDIHSIYDEFVSNIKLC